MILQSIQHANVMKSIVWDLAVII